MNTKHPTMLVALGICFIALTGCATGTVSPTYTATAETVAHAKPHCNLGVWIDRDLNQVRARYDAPPADSYEVTHYGPVIANQGCTDADILAWQELRREAGENDEICRVVIKDDYLAARTYPIGCAVPVMVVTDAPR